MAEFKLPDVGEGLTEAEIVTWHVKVGDTVKVNDTLCEIETAKSLVELPSPFAGVVQKLHVPAGETVPVGTVIVAIGADAPVSRPAAEPVARPAPEKAEEREAVLVGYGPRNGSRLASRRRPGGPPAERPPAERPPSRPGRAPAGRVLAKPPVRKLAKDLGIDLTALTPSGPGGVVTRDDVRTAAQQPAPAASPGETRMPVKGVRKATAEAMVRSAFTAPHATLWVQVDITRSMRLIRRMKADPAFAGASVSPLTLAARAVVLAAGRYPGIKARWDGDTIVTPDGIDLGIAVATDRGLVVPALRRVHTMSTLELARGLTELTGKARAGKAAPADLAGATLSITNIGVFGVDGGTPILTPGEPAILGLGRVTSRPWVHKGKVRPRDVVELVLSIDHRVIDGDLGGRFLATVARLLEDPASALGT